MSNQHQKHEPNKTSKTTPSNIHFPPNEIYLEKTKKKKLDKEWNLLVIEVESEQTFWRC